MIKRNKNLIAFLVCVVVGATIAYFVGAKDLRVGSFDDPFISIQLAPSPSAGYVLTTDGTENVWSVASAGTGDYPFTPTTAWGALAQSTTSLLAFPQGLISSSTIGNLTIGMLTATSTATSTLPQLTTTGLAVTGFLTGGAGGSDTQIQFNNNGSFAGARISYSVGGAGGRSNFLRATNDDGTIDIGSKGSGLVQLTTESFGNYIYLSDGDGMVFSSNSAFKFTQDSESTYSTLDFSRSTANRNFSYPNFSGSPALGSYHTGFLNGSIPFGSSGLLATSSALVFDSALSKLTVTNASTTNITVSNQVVFADGTTQNTSAGVTPDIKIDRALGSDVKAQRFNRTLVTRTSGIGDGTLHMAAIWLDNPATLTGIRYYHGTQGVYTADNYNGVGLYTYSGGTLTRVASSTDDGDIWKASAEMKTVPFSSPYVASAGLYYVAFLYNSSAQTTAPTLGASPAGVSLVMVAGAYTNSAKLTGQRTSQDTLPSSMDMADLSANNVSFWAELY